MEKISVIISLKNRTNFFVEYEPIQLKTFIRHQLSYSGIPKKNIKVNNQGINLQLLIEHLKSLEKLNYNFEVILADFNSTDYNLQKLIKTFPKLNIKIVTINDFFSRGKGLNAGLRVASHENIFFSDADMFFSTDEIFKEGLSAIKNNQVYFPVCFDLIDPTHQLGYWRESGYGLFMLSKKMINEKNFSWSEYDSLGKEDNDAFDLFKDISVRKRVNGYYHQWHPSSKQFKNQNYKHSNYDKQKVLINFKTYDYVFNKLVKESNLYYFTEQLELDITYVCNNGNEYYSTEKLKQYEKKFGKKLIFLTKNELMSKLNNSQIIVSEQNPTWLRKLLKWMDKIESSNYTWTTKGTDNWKLSATSLFAKLGKIYENYYQCNKEKIAENIFAFYDKEDGMFKQDDDNVKIIAESRQSYSALINLGIKFDRNIDIDKYYPKPLFFMNDKAWENPWSSGAQLSHYVFFCNLMGKDEEIKNVFNDLKKYEKPNGWYFGNPKPARLVNGAMKVFTAFDVVGKEVSPEILKSMADYLLNYDGYTGGCGIYDFIYCLLKCYKINYKKDEIKKKILELYDIMLNHQMTDGGFKYTDNKDKEDLYSGNRVNFPGLVGSIHASVLYSMALTKTNYDLDLGLNLELAFS